VLLLVFKQLLTTIETKSLMRLISNKHDSGNESKSGWSWPKLY